MDRGDLPKIIRVRTYEQWYPILDESSKSQILDVEVEVEDNFYLSGKKRLILTSRPNPRRFGIVWYQVQRGLASFGTKSFFMARLCTVRWPASVYINVPSPSSLCHKSVISARWCKSVKL
jgi:hypothetical protein